MGCSAFVAVSAKTGKNLKAVFEKACSIVQAQRKMAQGETVVADKHEVDGAVNITVTKKQNTKKREGCVML